MIMIRLDKDGLIVSTKSNVAGSEKTERKIQVKTPLNSEKSSFKSPPFSE